MAQAEVFSAYRALSPRDLAYLNNYHNANQRSGVPAAASPFDYGMMAVSRQWQGYAALKLIAEFGYGRKLTDNLVHNLFYPSPDPALPATIDGFYVRSNCFLAGRAVSAPPSTLKRKAPRSYWTGQPRRRRNYTGP